MTDDPASEIANPCPQCGAGRASLETACVECHWSPPATSDRPPVPLATRWEPGPVAVTAAFFAVDLVGPWIARDPITGSVLLGTVTGQFGVIAIWSAFGPPPTLRNWFVGVALAAGMVFTLALSSLGLGGSDLAVELLRSVLLLPLLLGALQIPILAFRLISGLHLRAGGHNAGRERSQYRIGHLMGFTVVISITLATARLAIPDAGLEAWVLVVAFLVGAMIWSLMYCIPAIWAITLSRSLPQGIFALVIYSGAITVIPGLAIALLGGPPVFLLLVIVSYAQMFTIGASLYALRAGRSYPYGESPCP